MEAEAACWLLWLLLVGWANRAMIVSGLAETLLSLGLFAAAIAPPAPCWQRKSKPPNDEPVDWLAGFSQRLMAVQITLIGLATFVTMLGGRVWFNGIGAYALAAPVEDRSIDWTTQAWFVNPLVHEMLTHAMVIALPLGFALAWLRRTNRIGQAILIGWCIVVALLGSHWLYASALATMVMAIRPVGRRSRRYCLFVVTRFIGSWSRSANRINAVTFEAEQDPRWVCTLSRYTVLQNKCSQRCPPIDWCQESTVAVGIAAVGQSSERDSVDLAVDSGRAASGS